MNEPKEPTYSGEDEVAIAKIGLNALSSILFVAFIALGVFITMRAAWTGRELWAALAGTFVVALLFALSPRVANQWEHAVVLRFGRYVGLRGPGMFWIIPFIDRIVVWIDLRVRATGFAAERTLTSDTVPVNVDAVLFWNVIDPEKSALKVENYQVAVGWAAQTALRDVIGKTDLANMLVGREHIDEQMLKLIDTRTRGWGIHVHSVEIRDVVIPPGLEDAMSRRAQAEREKQARVILGDAEVEIAAKFNKAADTYRDNAIALQLRSLNLLYEGMKERGTLMIVPSTMMDSMSIGAFAGLAALGEQQTALRRKTSTPASAPASGEHE